MRVGRIGAYSWQPRTDRWMWNTTMFRLHGYQPEAVTPTRSLRVAHKHTDTRDHAREVVDDACRSRSTYVCEHRIVAFDGRERDVVALGFPTPDTPRSSAGRRGYLIDVTPGTAEERLDPVRPAWWSVRPIHDEEVAHQALAALGEHLHLSPEAGLALLEWLAVARARPVDAIAGAVLAALGGPLGRRHPRRALLTATDPDVLPPPDR